MSRASRLYDAIGGTCYLRNVAAASAHVQARLARVLCRPDALLAETGEPIVMDVRPVAGVEPHFDQAVRDGRVRDDLYRRFSMIRIDMPPLRSRREDIPAIANYFLRGICASLEVAPKTLSRAALSLMAALPWRGNAPELREVLETVAASSDEATISLEAVLGSLRIDGGSVASAPRAGRSGRRTRSSSASTSPPCSSSIAAASATRRERSASSARISTEGCGVCGWTAPRSPASESIVRVTLHEVLDRTDQSNDSGCEVVHVARLDLRVVWLLSALMVALVVPSVPLSWPPAPPRRLRRPRRRARRAARRARRFRGIAMQLRNLQTGQIVGTHDHPTPTASSASKALAPGDYAVEIVNAAGEVVGTSASVLLTAPAMVATGLTATAVGERRWLVPGLGGGFFTSTWGIVTIAAIGAGVVGVTVAARPNASPSR